MNAQEHWEKIYGTKSPDRVSWFRPHLETSLALVERAARGDRSASIIDVGGGASTLVDDLIERGYLNLTILDISQAALDVAQARLHEAAKVVRWLPADVTQSNFPQRSFDVWHDRAVFHFLIGLAERAAYTALLTRTVPVGGHAVIATFALDGPERCSGLETRRYDGKTLAAELGPPFELLKSVPEIHVTPGGGRQSFQYSLFRRI